MAQELKEPSAILNWPRRWKLIILGVLLVALAVGAALFYQSYTQEREKDAARATWLAYWNTVVTDVQNRYIHDSNAIWSKNKKTPTKGQDSVMAALRREAKRLAAVEPPAELAAAHATLLLKLRTALREIGKHAKAWERIMSRPVAVWDFTAAQAQINGIDRELTAAYKHEKSTAAAWDEWTRAAKAEGRRLGYEGTLE